jgi:hypothetical protein
MKTKNLYNDFVDTLKKIYPEKSALAEKISDILAIEKASVYRRLRGEIPFTLNEAGVIAEKLHISLDQIIGLKDLDHSSFANMVLPLYNQFNGKDYPEMGAFIEKVASVVNGKESEMGMACNWIPSIFYYKYDHLLRFYIFKWGYRYNDTTYYNTFEKVKQGDRMVESQIILLQNAVAYEKIICLWDPLIINAIVNDIKYFFSIRLINDDDVAILKQELFDLLQDVESAAAVGKLEGLNKRFELYLSSLDIETTIFYGKSETEWISMIGTFSIQYAVSYEESAYHKMKDWIDYLKRFSMLLSGVGEKERVLFFETQREAVNSL